ncbi:MAG: FlgD immunoglobulin-like domain containing protein, partial [Planctomycetota bacterium]
AVAINDCGTSPEDTASDTVPCAAPQIDVEKVAQEATVANGGTIHYTITVRNPSASVTLENVRVVDDLCAYARWTGVSNPAPFSAPAVNSVGGIVEWRFASLAPGAEQVITFQVTADIAAGGGVCPTTVQCQNDVYATGECLGSGGQSSVRDDDTITTPITCVSDNCPRTVGFWGSQCAQRGNGSTKFTRDQVTQIAQCIDDRSSFFNWTAGTDFDNFCRTINPTTPMQQRKQAKRQFAGVLANLCTDFLNLQPSQGGRIFLDPSTPISCAGLEADTIGELIDEVDRILAELEGLDLNDPAVKTRYGQLISCLDAINNGLNIPVSSDCEHGGTTPTEDGDALGEEPSTDGLAVELYRPFPNPFTGSTAFAYSVEATDGATVDIAVYDVAGRQIRKLASGVKAAGRHTATWDGRNDSGAKANRGVYFVRTIIGGMKTATNRVLYLNE